MPTNSPPSWSSGATQSTLDPLGDAMRSSAAARSVNVKATMPIGATPSASRSATRWDTTSVLPEPAAAMICRWLPR